MGLNGLNLWAVLVSAISAFVLGGLWYAPFLLGGGKRRMDLGLMSRRLRARRSS